MILIVHPGTQHSYYLAQQLARHGKLHEFHTGLAIRREAWYARLASHMLVGMWDRRIATRVIGGVPATHLRIQPLRALTVMYRHRRGESPQAAFHRSNKEFQRTVPLRALKQSSGVIGFDTASWILAERAIAHGKLFFLDQSTAHPKARESVRRQIAERHPKWEQEGETRMASVLEAEAKEHQLATRIVVASTYAKQTLIARGVNAEKLVTNPYGVNCHIFHPSSEQKVRQGVRFLFLGTVSAIKGVPLLLEAWRSLNTSQSELWLVGPIDERRVKLIPSLPGLTIFGKLSHARLPELLRECDVLVFPSYSDGFGLVLLEALASGLPVIATDATGGPDLITNGREGFIVPTGDQDGLSKAMKYFIDNPEKIRGMSRAARRCAERFTWDAYGDRWNDLLNQYL